MKKVYEEASKQITGEEEVHARHILVETEDEAKAVKAELDKGADFAELAKEKSKDPGAADGGDLGFFTKEQMVPEFSTRAFALEPGKISDPVKTQFGWHIIKVEEKRNRKAPDFEQVKAADRAAMSPARPRPTTSPSCAQKPRSSAWTSRQRMRKPDAKPADRGQAAPTSKMARAREEVTNSTVTSRDANEYLKHRNGRATSPGHLHIQTSLTGDTRMASAVSPLAPKTVPDLPRDRRRPLCHGRGRHQVQEPHRRAAGGVGRGHGGRRRVHQVEMPVGAGRLVPRQSEGRQGARAGGQFRQRQCLHRQDRHAARPR